MGYRGEVLDRLAITPRPFIADPSVMDRMYVTLVDVQHTRVVIYGLLVLAHLREAVCAVVQSLHVVRLPEL